MCDKGRYTYKDSNYDRRLTHAKLAGVDLPHLEAMQMWATDLNVLLGTERSDEIGVYLSPHQTNEELRSLLDTLMGVFKVSKFFSEDVESLVKNDVAVDNFLLRSDPYPNSRGFLEAFKSKKIKLGSLEELLQGIDKQRLTHLIFVVPEGGRLNQTLSKIGERLRPDHFVVVLTPNLTAQSIFAAALNIPTLSHLEKTGTIVNHAGISQNLKSNFKMFSESFAIEDAMKHLVEAQTTARKTSQKAERVAN